MPGKPANQSYGGRAGDRTPRRRRADAERNLDALLRAAGKMFAAAGVDVPAREIAQKAGVGVGTVYRHFPRRADLIAAVFRREIDDCANAAPALARRHRPGEALARWMERYTDFVAAKRGLAKALHSGDPAFGTLRAHFERRLRPEFRKLYRSAVAAGEARRGINPEDLLDAVAGLCLPAFDKGPRCARRMVAILVDGLRHGGN